jgi:hypothetical protein
MKEIRSQNGHFLLTSAVSLWLRRGIKEIHSQNGYFSSTSVVSLWLKEEIFLLTSFVSLWLSRLLEICSQNEHFSLTSAAVGSAKRQTS